MFDFSMAMVIVFVPISWTTGLFLRYFSFGKVEAFQMLLYSSHLIILIPLLDSAALAFSLKVPLVPQNNSGTLSEPRRWRKDTLLANSQTPRITFLCPVPPHIYCIFSP